MSDQAILLRRVKIGITIMLAVFAMHLVVRSPEYWPITRWGMYQRIGQVPEKHDAYLIEVTDNAGNHHNVYSWELSFQGADVFNRAFYEDQLTTYAPLLIDMVQQQLSDIEITHLSVWRADWNVDASALPPFEPDQPDNLTILGQFPADFYAVDPAYDTTVDLHFGGLLGLTDFRILGEQTIQPCDTVFVHTHWQVLQQPAIDYQITLVLADGSGIGRAQSDGPLADQLTSAWQSNSYHLDRRMMDIPCDLFPGDYSLLVGIYDLETVENLTVTYPDGSPYGQLAYLTTFTVES
jgi:hypothetical protein